MRKKSEFEIPTVSVEAFETVLTSAHRDTAIILGFSATILTLIILVSKQYSLLRWELDILVFPLALAMAFFLYAMRTLILTLHLVHREKFKKSTILTKDIWIFAMRADMSNEIARALLILTIFSLLLFSGFVIPAVGMMLALNFLFSRWVFRELVKEVEKAGAFPDLTALLPVFAFAKRAIVNITRVWTPLFLVTYYLNEYIKPFKEMSPLMWLLIYVGGVLISIVLVRQKKLFTGT